MSTQQRPGYKVGSDPGNVGHLFDKATGIAMLVALSAMVFMRRKVGLRKLGIGTLVSMTLCMLAASWFHNLHFSFLGGITSGGDDSLFYFALVALGIGLWGRRKRKEEIRRGEPGHTFSQGVTWFDFLPIREDFIYRFVDPAVVFLTGAVLHKLGLALGSWLMAAGIAFAIVEHAVYAKGEEQFFNDLDTSLEAQLRAGIMSRFANHEAVPLRDGEETTIATGADAQLAAEIEKRRRNSVEGRIQ
jgi:hypothetical protein